ncbi:guanine nucleotide exchange factor in Golgi transport N-terminal-domain-containing protein [Schizophyllum fasciatum]
MGCATKNAKVVAISLGSLQRLIGMKAVPPSAVPLIINTAADAMSQGVDIQLRILQTILSLITNFPEIHGQQLADALLVCFRLHESRIAVVSSTAAATLRQLVMFVVDKMAGESDTELLEDVQLPDGSSKSLPPSARDAFAVFEDLCLLANSEKPHFLQLDYLHKTFALELIESVLTNYHALFRQHPELTLLLRHHLCPLLIKALSDRPQFALTLRCTRVVFLLLKQFHAELLTEAEVFLVMLIKIITEDSEVEPAEHAPRPHWMRVIAMEIMRGLCSDAELVRGIYDRYDAQDADNSNVYASLVTALNRLLSEKPSLLGVGTQIHGIGVPAEGSSSSYSLESVSGMTGMVATAASATVSGVVNMLGSTGGLSMQNSTLKLQCIDQLDKAEAPPIPESYIYLLGLQCLVSLCEGFAAYTGPLYTALVIQRPRAAGDAVIRAPPALDVSSLPPDEPTTKQLNIVQRCIGDGWPALLAGLSFIISTNLSDELFADVLAAFQALTNAAGMLGLSTPRDALITSLARFAVPTRVVSAVDQADTQGPQPGLSERNMACLKVLVGCAMFLAGSLGASWFGVLEVLQNADYVLSARRRAPPSIPSTPITSTQPTFTPRPPILADVDPETLLNAIQRLFDASKNLEDAAFSQFLNALCKLSAEMVAMQAGEQASMEPLSPRSELPPTPRTPRMDRRRVSGIHLPRTLVSHIKAGDFGLTKLGGVLLMNMHRLIYRSPDVAWESATSHLLMIIRLTSAPQTIRVQAARVLDDVLVRVPRNVSSAGELQAAVQGRVLSVLSQQVIPAEGTPWSTSELELRRLGLETLHQILQSSGHTLVVGWKVIFEMLSSVCAPPTAAAVGAPEKLVKIAFQSLTIVIDAVANLAPEHLRLCIGTLGQFGRQADTNVALTAAASLMWSVSDAIQAKRKNAESEREYSALWMVLLRELLGLGSDARPEVRDGAIQTLFRAMLLYGATLGYETWSQCIWDVVFPLLEQLTAEMRAAQARATLTGEEDAPDDAAAAKGAWDDSKTLALQSLGAIFRDFLVSHMMQLDEFEKAWDAFVAHVVETVLLDDRSITVPALQCLNLGVRAAASAGAGEELRERVNAVWIRTWAAIDRMGDAVLKRVTVDPDDVMPYAPFTQSSLVALIELIGSVRALSKTLDEAEWPLERLTRLMTILKGIMTYPSSPDYRPDADNLTPVQAAVIDSVLSIELAGPGVASRVMYDLSEFALLAFLAAFDVPPPPKTFTAKGAAVPTSSTKRITYIALTKRAMPLLVDLFLRFKDQSAIYTDGTLDAVLSAYAIPMKLKYDCPPASKFGKDEPLWKTATRSFLRIVKEVGPQMKAQSDDIGAEHIEVIWRQVLDVFRGAILADCSAIEELPLDEQEVEENFDLSLIAALEIDVAPYIGEACVPDHLVAQLAKILYRGSNLWEAGSHARRNGVKTPTSATASSSPPSPDYVKVEWDLPGSTEQTTTVPRERFSYWCFDLLFLICSSVTNDSETSRRRLAAFSLPSLLDRCRRAMLSFVADEALRGGLPFSRVREEELIYLLRKLLELRLYSGSLWAATSDDPSKYCLSQPDIDTTQGHSALLADVAKRSPKAHLFHLYPVLCEIAASPRAPPTTWASPGASSAATNGELLDARTLARQCLKEIGTELGCT